MPMFSAIAEPEHSFGQVLAAPQQTIGRTRKSSTPRPRFSLSERLGCVKLSDRVGGVVGCSVGARAYLGPRPPGRAVGGVMVDWSSLGSTPAARSLSGSPLWVGATEAEGAGWKLEAIV